MTLLKENILEQQEHLHDVKMECFTQIQKMVDKVKVLENHLEIVSQINLKMESLQVKIEELDKWMSIEKNVPSILLIIKTYDLLPLNVNNQPLDLKKKLDIILQE